MLSFYLLIAAVVSYFIGNINWAVIISKIKKQDIRKMGSGNPGTLNVSRNFGLKTGLLVFILDISKGAVPALVSFFVFKGRYFFQSSFLVSDFAVYFCGLSAVLGHIYPMLLKFKGGKGIATTIGALVACEALHGLGWAAVSVMSLVAALVFIYLTEFGAMGSFIAITPMAVSGSIRLFLTYGGTTDKVCLTFNIIANLFILFICFFTWFAHRKNIQRMLAGDEHPTSIKEMVVKMRAKKLASKVENKNKTVDE